MWLLVWLLAIAAEVRECKFFHLARWRSGW